MMAWRSLLVQLHLSIVARQRSCHFTVVTSLGPWEAVLFRSTPSLELKRAVVVSEEHSTSVPECGSIF